MVFLWSFAFILFTAIGFNHQDTNDIKIYSSLSILPPPMNPVCLPANTTYVDQITSVPEQNIVTFLDWTPHVGSVPEFNSSVIIMDQLPHVGSVPEFNSSVIIMDQLPHVGSVPEFNSSVIIMDQLPNVGSASEFNSSFIITDQMSHVDSVPEFKSASKPAATSKHVATSKPAATSETAATLEPAETSEPAAFTMDQYIDFSVPVLKSKAASRALNDGFTSGSERFQLLNFADLLSFVRLAQVAVAILMVLLLWKQRQESLYLHQEIISAEQATTTDLSRLGEMRNKLYSEHIQLTKSDKDLSTWDKKMDGVSSKLHDENSNLEEMYKCLVEWKHDWNEQSHKIKQKDTDQFKQIADLPNIDQLIKEQEQSLGDYLLHAEEQFSQISQNFVDGHNSITGISAGLGSIYDVMNEQSASHF